MEKYTKNKINYILFSTMFIVLSFFILQDFVFGMISGAMLALSIWPLFEWICAKDSKFFKGKVSDSALLLSFISTLIIIIPLSYGIYEIYHIYNISDVYVSSTVQTSNPPSFLIGLPFSDKIVNLWTTYISSSGSVIEVFNKASNGKLLSLFSYVWSNLIEKVITIIVMIISFYLVLKNGDHVKKNYRLFFTQLLSENAVRHIDCGISAFRATINGVVLVGLVEGILLSIPMIFAGFSSGFLIAVVAGLLGVIPLLLPLIITPFLLYMYYMGYEVWAIIGFVDLFIVWIVFENVIKPKVIGKTVKINTFLILISMIGGMQLMGILGLLIGPAVISVTLAVVKDVISSFVSD